MIPCGVCGTYSQAVTCSRDHANRFRSALPHVRLTNGYGVAESTSLSCCYDIGELVPRDQAVPIGRPIPGTRAYVLNSDGNPASIAEHGELCLAGDGFSLGYFDQPELTVQKFLADPFQPDPDERIRSRSVVSGWSSARSRLP